MRQRVVLAIVALIGATVVPSVVGAPVAGAATAGDGTTAATAGPSCWSIKQGFPASADGVYWLQTPKLVAPQQFRCDMTTDGGGWVLVGRGREGWSFGISGQGAAANVRTTPTGTAAFAPAALPTETVDGLLDGGRVDALPDGVRVRRALDGAGSTWQEVRWKIKNIGAWSWAFGGGQLLTSIAINGVTYPVTNPTWTSGSTRDTTAPGGDGRYRLYTYTDASHNSKAGFAYGTSVAGVNNATSYLWQYTTEKKAIPFAQVWLRPRLTAATVSYPAIPDTGAPASTRSPLLETAPQHMPWGVTGLLKVDDPVPTLDVQVLGLEQIGSTAYVGGKFQNVTQSGGASTEQRFLAAFDVDTGAWRSGFRPVVDGAVWDLAATPDGKLLVAGNFTSINGAPNTSGLAALDPTTGAVLPGWTAAVTTPYSTSVRPYVRAIDVKGDWLYVAGGFKKILGGTPLSAPVTVGRLARVRLSDGKPDGTWKPNVNGGIVDLNISPTGDRAYLAGSFTLVNTTTVNQIAAVDTTTGAPIVIPWLDDSTGTEPQNTIHEFGNRLYIGGSQHYLHQYDRDTFALLRSHITRVGGDFQAMAVVGDVLYASCHCTNWDFQDATTFGDPTNYSRVDPMNYIGAYDLQTLERLPFQPALHSLNGEGPWRLFTDDRGCMWSGGDSDRGRYGANGAQEWVGGFVRFCPRDTTAPSAPASLNATATGPSVTLTWPAATDNVGVTGYELLRDDRVIATVYGTTTTDTPTGNARYFVRAYDAAGNRSATTAAVKVLSAPPVVADLIAAGSTWRYRADGSDQGVAWRTSGFDASAWPSGAGQLGWGDGDEATTIPSAGVTGYFRRQFTVTDPAAISTLLLRVLRDDAAAVYVNGIEVVRSNLPAGTLNASTLASTFVSGTGETTWTDYPVPASMLVAGTNTVAVELHQGSAGNGDATFDLSLQGRSRVESSAPTAPTGLAVTGRTGTTIGLGWTAATDDSGIIGYRIRRDGVDVAFTAATTFVDSGLGVGSGHSYEVVAVDPSGNASAPATLTASTTPDPTLVAMNASWKWRFAAGDPGATWKTAAFDDSAWPVGAAELGAADGDEATVIWSGTKTPTTAYFRRTFSVTDPSAVRALTLDVIRDDGVAVYVNGVEVARNNLPAGATYATFAPVTMVSRAEETTPVTFSVPPGVLVAGTNTIAVEVHQAGAASADLSFALRLIAAF